MLVYGQQETRQGLRSLLDHFNQSWGRVLGEMKFWPRHFSPSNISRLKLGRPKFLKHLFGRKWQGRGKSNSSSRNRLFHFPPSSLLKCRQPPIYSGRVIEEVYMGPRNMRIFLRSRWGRLFLPWDLTLNDPSESELCFSSLVNRFRDDCGTCLNRIMTKQMKSWNLRATILLYQLSKCTNSFWAPFVMLNGIPWPRILKSGVYLGRMFVVFRRSNLPWDRSRSRGCLRAC